MKLGVRASGWRAEDVLRVARKLGVTVQDGRVVVGRRTTKKEMTLVTMREWDELVTRSMRDLEPAPDTLEFADFMEKALASFERQKKKR